MRGDQDAEPDARSVVNRVLVVATAMLLTAELLALIAILTVVLEVYAGIK